VRAATGVSLTTIPRPLGLECHALGTVAEERTRIVWLDAPAGLEPGWLHGDAHCRFMPLTALAGLDARAPVARIVAAV
jgi:hypothetical protein